jgi:predicted cation transporter
MFLKEKRKEIKLNTICRSKQLTGICGASRIPLGHPVSSSTIRDGKESLLFVIVVVFSNMIGGIKDRNL